MEPGYSAAQKYFKDYKIINAGISGDKIEHILWRITHIKSKKLDPKYIILTAGVNNFSNNNAQEISEGILNLVRVITEKFSRSKLILFGPLPTGIKAQ